MKRDEMVNFDGWFGEFGGTFIPEMLFKNVDELQRRYDDIIRSEEFQSMFRHLLKDYVGRPTPLGYARRMSEKYGYRIYLKREDLCHTGAHKINNTIGQILLAQKLGKRRIVAETGAGQHGVATATVCAMMDMPCIVYMGALDMKRQKPNVDRMKMLGAEVRPAVSGNQTLKDATNEAMRHWINYPDDTHYIIGSVVGPHPYPDMVARFQSVISEEIVSQMRDMTGEPAPDAIIACVGGGSNAMGAFYHYLHNEDVRLIAVEAAGKGLSSGESAATTQLGRAGVLHGCRTIFMQTPDGQVVEPHSISAGLDYPGIGPQPANFFTNGRVIFTSATDDEAVQGGFEMSRLEGIIPALETAHAVSIMGRIGSLGVREGSRVVVCVSGRGDKDLATYSEYL